MLPAPLLFALVLSGLHAGALFLTDATFAWMFRRGIVARRQVDAGKPPKPDMLARCVREVALGQITFALLMGLVVYPLWAGRGGRVDLAWAPPAQIVLHLAAFALLNETMFYASHRLLHVPWLYRRVHARHHRFVHVRVPVAEYAHPIENAANFAAFFAGPILFGTPFTTLCIWVVLRIVETAEAHSGYELTSSGSRHAFHHMHPHDGCYGSFLGLWDTVLRTDRAWRVSRRGHRARALADPGRQR